MGAEAGKDKVEAGARRARPRRRRLWKLLVLAPFLLVALTIVQVALLRFIDPPFSTVMAARQLEQWGTGNWDYRIHYQWRDLEQMAPSLPISLVAAEDQQFPHHRGFDVEAIRKARSHNAGGVACAGPARSASRWPRTCSSGRAVAGCARAWKPGTRC
jgi:Membrane carboxypeptidase (penicillin-binding protein)